MSRQKNEPKVQPAKESLTPKESLHVDVDALDLGPLVDAAEALLRALEEYHQWAAACHWRLTNPAVAPRWVRVGCAVLAMEQELSHLGLGPDPALPRSTSFPPNLDVPLFAEWMRTMRGGADGWGERADGGWSLEIGTTRLPDVSDALAQLRLHLSGWQKEAGPMIETPAETAASQEEVQPRNVFRLTGEVWHVHYEEDDEAGNFPDRSDSVLRHLARLLVEPNRRFGALVFYPPPPGTASLPYLGRDERTDSQAMEEYKKRLKQLTQEIKEAKDAYDTDTANKLHAEFDKLMNHVKSEKAARGRGHQKRCGTFSPTEKADQTLRVGLGNLMKRFRVKNLPKLAAHLDKYLGNTACEWWYAPPPGTSLWHVTCPDLPAEN
jgi:hypothetical protein